jgi:CheY-like chemotaxis protein
MKKSAQKRILIIESDPNFRKTLKMHLESNGYLTLHTENGLEGLKKVRKENPDLIITDIMLPGLDGHKVCRMIKFDRNLAHIPVIVLTSRDLDQDAELAKQCGADAFILKSTKAPIVMEVIRKLLEKTAPSTSSHDEER